MKITVILKTIFMSLLSVAVFAQQTRVELLSTTADKTVIRVTTQGFDWKTVETSKGQAKVITLENGIPIHKDGAPDLPKLSALVNVPASKKLKLEVTSSNFVDFENMEVAPFMSKLSTTDNVAHFGDVYNKDSFFPHKLVKKKKPLTLEGEHVMAIVIQPVQYNPVTKTVRLYNELVISITTDDKDEASSVMKQDETGDNDLIIYPNPTSGLLNIKYQSSDETDLSIDVFNSCGQHVYSKTNIAKSEDLNSFAFDASVLDAGIYSLSFRTATKSRTERIVVQ